MKRFALTLTAVLTLVSPASAQQAADEAPLSSYLRRSFAALARDLAAVAEMMPEQDFTFRPAGVVSEVRTFGQILAHLTLVNDWVCSMGDGKPTSPAAADTSVAHSKARLVALVTETNTRCTAYLSAMTDADLTNVLTTRAGPRQVESVLGNAIVFAIAHSNEHYGNLVTYLRAKGLVPPATPSQAVFFAPVRSDP
jgi:uncharacterized damage-inducible protein DinB